jgi:hypothetical protein
MPLEKVSGCPWQTVEKQGSSVFCVSKSSEAERERMKPPERNERVCRGQPDTDTFFNGKYELIILLIPDLNFNTCPPQKGTMFRPCISRMRDLLTQKAHDCHDNEI